MPDEREEHDVGVHSHHGLVVQWRVAGPAGGEAAEEDRRDEDEAGGHQQPERQRLDPREGHAPGADHERHEVVGERAEDARGHHPHHHRAVHAHEREVLVGADDVGTGVQQLGADQHRVDAADEEEHADPHEVLHADDLVVGAQAEVAPDALALLLAQRGRTSEQSRDGVVGEAEADQEADHAERRSRAAARRRSRRSPSRSRSLGAVDQVADEPAQVVAADAEDDGGQQVEADQAPPHRRSVGWGAAAASLDRAHSASPRRFG